MYQEMHAILIMHLWDSYKYETGHELTLDIEH